MMQTGDPLSVPLRINLPIMIASNCEDDKKKMIPPLEQYGKNVRFVQCKTVSGEMYDHLEVEMEATIVQKSKYVDDKSFGMFGIVVSEESVGRITIEFVTTKSVANAVSAIDKSYVMQTVELDDMSLTTVFNNDTRNPVIFEIDGSFVDGKAIDVPTEFTLERRSRIEVIPSNVRSISIIRNGIGRFGRIIVN